MAKQYKKLRSKLMENDIDMGYVSEALNCSRSCISQRFNVKQPWNMQEVYKLCDLLKIPYEEIHIYFPANG